MRFDLSFGLIRIFIGVSVLSTPITRKVEHRRLVNDLKLSLRYIFYSISFFFFLLFMQLSS